MKGALIKLPVVELEVNTFEYKKAPNDKNHMGLFYIINFYFSSGVLNVSGNSKSPEIVFNTLFSK